jgi:hypothetical protein
MKVKGIQVLVGDVWEDTLGTFRVTAVGETACLAMFEGDPKEHRIEYPFAPSALLRRRALETEDRDRKKWEYSDEPGWNNRIEDPDIEKMPSNAWRHPKYPKIWIRDRTHIPCPVCESPYVSFYGQGTMFRVPLRCANGHCFAVCLKERNGEVDRWAEIHVGE